MNLSDESSLFDSMLDDELIMDVCENFLFDSHMDNSLDDQLCVNAIEEVLRTEESCFDAMLDDSSMDWCVTEDFSTLPSAALGSNDDQVSNIDLTTKKQEKCQIGYGNNHSDVDIEFNVIEEGPWRVNQAFHSKTKLLRAKITYDENDQLDLTRVSDAIDTAYERFVQNLITDAQDNDRIFITFRNMSQEREMYISFLKRNFNKEEFLQRAYKLAQSAGAFIDGSTFEIKVQIIQSITGNGRKKVSGLLTGSIRSALKKSVLVIENDDHKCGYYAVAMSKFHHDNIKDTEHDIRQWTTTKNSFIQHKKIAGDLFMDSGIDCSIPVDIEKLYQIQEFLKDYQIIAVDQRSQLKLFSGAEKVKKLFLEYSEPGHWNCITSIRGYLECDKFCTRCWIKLHPGRNHICKDGCPKCSSVYVCTKDVEKDCEVCISSFPSEKCYNNHLENNVCKRRKRCEYCWVILPAGDTHTCGEFDCNFCGCVYRNSPHYCYIKPLNLEKLQESDEKPSFLICYDIESMQVSINDNELSHMPNLLISQTLCSDCMDTTTAKKKTPTCDICGEFEHIWYGTDCVKNFCDYLYNEIAPSAAHAKAAVTIIAHNQRGYDGHFIVQDFFKRDFQATPEMIMTGSKILYSHIENLRFIDSLSLFMQPLSSLVKSFNIVEMKKGFFPHLFNCPENQEYIGEWPSSDYYNPSQMKPSQQTEFMTWYDDQLGKNFDFKSEIIEYCRSDVNILMTAMIRFINLFQSITGLNPIVRNFTLASVAMEVFRATMLSKSTLGITPISGYAERKQSISAASWLDSMEKIRGRLINREWRVGPFYADGFIPETKEVFEFWGCYFHGCSFCYTDRNTKVKSGDEETTVAKLLEKVEYKKRYYQHLGYKLTEIWEHDFDRCDPYTSTRIQHYETIKKVGQINIRESFFGGRTNNIKFYHKCGSDEKIRYLDFTSLYPYVLQKYQYPMAHPTLIQGDFKDIKTYFGFIKCKVIAPTSINIGVLPLRIDKKLMFPLCKTCAVNKIQSDCQHNQSEKAMTNTWTSIELQEAVKVGYKIIKIYQVLDYRRNNTHNSLFAKYVRMWLKIKQEASGWPSWCQTQEDKQKYIKDYSERENVDLDFNCIEKNPGKRSIAKLMLNSFWGKLAQSHNLPQTKFLRSYADLWALLSNDEKEVMGIHEASEVTILTQSKFKDNDNANINPGKTNIAVASFVTAYARLELFRLIQNIESQREGRVLYFDTDSVVFIERDGDPEVKCGDYLGELTDEIPQNFICDTFVTLGPKNYGYEIFNPTTNERKATIKVKGIKLTSAALDLISIEQLVSMANDYSNGVHQQLNIKQSNIISDKFTHIVKTRNFEKIYRAVSEKRKLFGNNTRPYGYVNR